MGFIVVTVCSLLVGKPSCQSQACQTINEQTAAFDKEGTEATFFFVRSAETMNFLLAWHDSGLENSVTTNILTNGTHILNFLWPGKMC